MITVEYLDGSANAVKKRTICLTQYLFWEASGKHLNCKDCPFFKSCTDEVKEADG